METILISLLEEMRSLAPEVLEGLVAMQVAKYTIFAALWWKFLLLAIVCGGALFYLCKSCGAEWYEGLAVVLVIIAIFAFVAALVMVLLLIDRPVFNAAPEVYVLRSLLNR